MMSLQKLEQKKKEEKKKKEKESPPSLFLHLFP
jgi:hypothetical protein